MLWATLVVQVEANLEWAPGSRSYMPNQYAERKAKQEEAEDEPGWGMDPMAVTHQARHIRTLL